MKTDQVQSPPNLTSTYEFNTFENNLHWLLLRFEQDIQWDDNGHPIETDVKQCYMVLAAEKFQKLAFSYMEGKGVHSDTIV